MADTRPNHREGMNQIRHYLAHATMGLVAIEAEARKVLGDETFDEATRCLDRARMAIDAWLNRELPST